MKETEENKQLAILYKNFHGPKVDDWITIAIACKQLIGVYGSQAKLAKKVGKSREQIREILKLLNLPVEVQRLLQKEQISKEVAWRIAGIPDKKNQTKIAKAVKGLSSHDGRELVYYFTRNPKIDIEGYKNKILKSKDKTENISVLILPLPEEDFKKLKIKAEKHYISPQKLVIELINKFLKGK